MKTWLLACAFVLLGGACDPATARSASDSRAPEEVCSAALPGTDCDLFITDGNPPVVSRCKKLGDGSLLCDSSDAHRGGSP